MELVSNPKDVTTLLTKSDWTDVVSAPHLYPLYFIPKLISIVGRSAYSWNRAEV
jgi:hypothetical protein